MATEPIEVTICLGSSCFARGNNRNLEIIQQFFEEHNLNGKIDFRGHLCEDTCKKGPTLQIGTEVYCNVTTEVLPSILEKSFLK